MRFLRYAADCAVWDKERGDRIRSHLGMRKLDKQIHERKKNWLEHLPRILSERAPKEFCIINGEEDVIQEGHEIDGLMFEDGMS
jgi:hypothetical protein